MDALIDRATEDPQEALDFSGRLPDIERLFGNEETLLLALQHRWTTTLTAKLDQAHHEGVPPERARAELAVQQPGLRALLDAASQRSVRVRALQHREHAVTGQFDGMPIPLQTIA